MHTSSPGFEMPNEEQVSLAAEYFRLLADPTRIKMLWALPHGEAANGHVHTLLNQARYHADQIDREP